MPILEGNIVAPAAFDYETVAVSQTDQILGGRTSAADTACIGDRIERLIVTVSTAATSTVTLKDGTTSITILVATTPIGVYAVPLGMLSLTGPWSLTTGAGASVIAVGRFTK